MALIECKNVSLGYENRIVCSGLNFRVERGDFLSVVGENGSGKSTLMKAILGLKETADGHLHFGDGLTARQIGYLPQQTTLQRDFPASVQEVVLSGCLAAKGRHLFFQKAQRDRAAAAMARLDLLGLKHRCYRELSGGQQQRVLLARALCATETLLLLDEPVAGLDPLVTADFYRLVQTLNREDGVTVIMVSHDLFDALALSTHILHMQGGSAFFGTRDDYLASDFYRRLAGGDRHV
ncbi:MAG: metal ABC transporter ATP-binding protein [Clostridia bacterium]|nr:metal ABC transporter ATP-binding protein [Clostridia bacterium]MBR3552801.1 metal ABC transporter ATP-binding protein [Clostridia bacterium]